MGDTMLSFNIQVSFRGRGLANHLFFGLPQATVPNPIIRYDCLRWLIEYRQGVVSFVVTHRCNFPSGGSCGIMMTMKVPVLLSLHRGRAAAVFLGLIGWIAGNERPSRRGEGDGIRNDARHIDNNLCSPWKNCQVAGTPGRQPHFSQFELFTDRCIMMDLSIVRWDCLYQTFQRQRINPARRQPGI